MSVAADAWVPMLVAGTLLLVGFAASLLFERYRVPDFFLLMLLGVVLGLIPWAPFGPDMVMALDPILPVFLHLTLAFLLFEGGLALRGAAPGPVTGPLLGSMALTGVLAWFVGSQVLGLTVFGALVLAVALSGPSATLVLSFAPHLRLGQRAQGLLSNEAILGTVVSAVGLLMILRLPASIDSGSLVPFLSQLVLGASFAFILGTGWRIATGSLLAFRFQYIATIAVAVVIYAVAEGVIGQNGAIAAFVFGLVISYQRPGQAKMEHLEDRGLHAFQAEISFGMRAFFFVYLGLLIGLESFTGLIFLGALLLTAAFVVGRLPASAALGRAHSLSQRERRAVTAAVARGLPDVVLVLFALQSGVLLAFEHPILVGILPLVILISAINCAGLVLWAERGSEARPEARKDIYHM